MIAAVAAWVVVRQSFATLPPLPWTAVPAMLLLAVGEAVAGHNLRARLTGRRAGKPLEPIAVARMAALAKASSAAAAAAGRPGRRVRHLRDRAAGQGGAAA